MMMFGDYFSALDGVLHQLIALAEWRLHLTLESVCLNIRSVHSFNVASGDEVNIKTVPSEKLQ